MLLANPGHDQSPSDTAARERIFASHGEPEGLSVADQNCASASMSAASSTTVLSRPIMDEILHCPPVAGGRVGGVLVTPDSYRRTSAHAAGRASPSGRPEAPLWGARTLVALRGWVALTRHRHPRYSYYIKGVAVTTKWLETMDDVLPGVDVTGNEESTAAPAAAVHAALIRALEGNAKATLVIDGQSWNLGKGVLQFVHDSVDTLGQGLRVSYVAEDSLLSPEDVAGLLGVSRPFVYKLMDTGALPVAAQNGTHRKVAASAAVAWREAQHLRVDEADRIAATAESEPVRSRAERRAALRAAVQAAHTSGDTTGLRTEGVRGQRDRSASAAVAAPVQARTSRKGSR